MATQPIHPEKTDPKDPIIGLKILDQYEVEQKLGAGGMGAVYQAQQLGLDRKVVVKFLLPELGASEDMIARFNREARSASRLDHPNIVKVFNFGDSGGGRLYLAMEYVQGITLKELIAQKKHLSVATVCDIGVQLADALAFAHREQVVHRDLKPENILLADINGRLVPKIVDFGIAKILGADTQTGPNNLTMHGRVYGTPNYMSPEQAEGISADAPSDIYSLGVILYEMLTGERPIQGTSAMAQLVALMTQEPKSLTTFEDLEIPEDLQDVIMKMLKKKTTERTASMNEVREHLEKIHTRIKEKELGLSKKRLLTIATVVVILVLLFLGVTRYQRLRNQYLAEALQKAEAETVAAKVQPLPPQLIETSSPTIPDWFGQTGVIPEENGVWRFRVEALKVSSLETARTLLNNDVAEEVLLQMATHVQLKNFSQAIYLPINAAKSEILKRVTAAAEHHDTIETERLQQDIKERQTRIASMFYARFPDSLKLEDMYWKKFAQTNGGASENFLFDVYGLFSVDAKSLNLRYYEETFSQPQLGVVITHFFPSLIWVHDIQNGVVILDVLPNSPAAAAGIKATDVIVRIDGEPINGLEGFKSNLTHVLEKLNQQQGVTLVISRQGEQQPIALRPLSKK